MEGIEDGSWLTLGDSDGVDVGLPVLVGFGVDVAAVALGDVCVGVDVVIGVIGGVVGGGD